MITDWDDAYENAGYIPGADDYGPKWEALAEAFRAIARMDVISTGPQEREELDLFWPDAFPKGLAIFIHGGYWRSRHRRNWSHLAAGALANGWAFAMPGYSLCPDVSIADITQQVRAAIDLAAEHVAGPIRISGHSAGGHLAARMACEDVDLKCFDRVERVLPISGVHDLRPLIKTKMNDDFRMSLTDAAAESPALLTPKTGADLVAWVGAAERPEFVRQNALLASAWSGCFIETRQVEIPGQNHFTVIEGLSDANDPLTQALIGD